MGRLLNAGQVLATNAWLFPDRIGARDLERSMTFQLWNERASRLANGLRGLGLVKGDRVAVLADKKVIAVGTIDQLLKTEHPWIQEYFNGPRGRAATAAVAALEKETV